MLNTVQLDSILCLDIETVPQYKTFSESPEEVQKFWEKKSEFFRQEETDTPETLYSRAGIYAEFGKIVCITTGFLATIDGKRQFRLKSFYGHDEAKLLVEFNALLVKLKPTMLLCGHNAKEFDFPYLCRRMIVNNIPIPKQLDIAGKKPWEVQHLDTMELWKFGDYKNYTPLNLLAYILGIPSPKDDIDGSEVGGVYWIENNLERIVHYCQKDVVTVMQILLRLKNEVLLSKEEIYS